MQALKPSAAHVLGGPLLPALVAGVLGLTAIGSKSLWLDEAFSVSVARLPTVDLIVFLWRNELHGSPHILLLQPWLALGDVRCDRGTHVRADWAADPAAGPSTIALKHAARCRQA